MGGCRTADCRELGGCGEGDPNHLDPNNNDLSQWILSDIWQMYNPFLFAPHPKCEETESVAVFDPWR